VALVPALAHGPFAYTGALVAAWATVPERRVSESAAKRVVRIFLFI